MLAFDTMISAAVSAGVNIDDTVANQRTITATATAANINVADILAGLNANRDVFISNGAAGAEVGNITWDALLDYNGIVGTQTLTIATDASGTDAYVVLKNNAGDTAIYDSSAGGESLNITIKAHQDVHVQDNIRSGGGNVTFNSDTDEIGGGGIFLSAEADVDSTGTSSDGNITLGGGDDPLNKPAIGTAGTDGDGIHVRDSATLTAGTGNISLRGTGQDNTGSEPNLGMILFNGTTIQTSSGNITLVGTGGDGGDNGGLRRIGVGLEQNNLITTATGDISITGTAGAGDDAVGIDLDLSPVGNSITLTGAGSITLTGTGGGSAAGIQMNHANSVIGGTAATGPITLITDSVDLNAGSVDSNGALTIKPVTAGTAINLGGGTGGLDLDDTELMKLQDGFSSITIGDSSLANAAAGTGFQLVEVGPTGNPVAANLANAAGAIAFAKDLLPGFAAHTIPHLNDGLYGNANSWIGNSDPSFAGVNLNGSFTISQMAFGRDNLGTFNGRTAGTYELQYTTVANPDENTSDGSWTTIDTVTHTNASAIRNLYQFDPVTATGVRIVVDASGSGNGSFIAIDEIEVYGIRGNVDIDTATFKDPVTIVGSTINDNAGTDITNTDTTNPTVTLDGTVAPGQSPGILNVAGNFAFADNDTFKVEIGGTSPGTENDEHDQIKVTSGDVTIGANVALDLSSFNSYTPVGGETFTIIDLVTSGKSITGKFATISGGTDANGGILDQGDTINNFFGTSLDATISYAAGTNSNDVVITVLKPLNTQVEVTGGNLEVTDIGGGVAQNLTYSVSGGNLTITDSDGNRLSLVGSGGTVGASSVTVPLSEFNNGTLDIDSGAGADTHTFDSTFDIGTGTSLNVDGGADSDTVTWEATAQLAALTLAAETINLNSGTVNTGVGNQVYNGNVILDGLNVVAYDGFDYTTGAIAGQNGGIGWGGAWTAAGVVESGSLSYPVDEDDNGLPSVGNRYRTSGTNNAADRVLAEPLGDSNGPGAMRFSGLI